MLFAARTLNVVGVCEAVNAAAEPEAVERVLKPGLPMMPAASYTSVLPNGSSPFVPYQTALYGESQFP